MGLDERGYIAILELVAYTPVLVSSGFLIFKHGFGRSGGWISLLILSMIRIVGASIHLALESSGRKITSNILEVTGLSPLLLATLGFLQTISERAFDHKINVPLHLFGIISAVALGFSLVGGTTISSANGNRSKLDKGATYRHVGAILFLVLYALIAMMHGIFWLKRHEIMKNRRKLLACVSIALPFLAVRLIYTVLASYAPLDPTATGGLAIFNSSTGTWYIYLTMGVLSEILAVIIYVFAGLTIPLNDDYVSTKMQRWDGEDDRQHTVP